jgi:hypothetical protein
MSTDIPLVRPGEVISSDLWNQFVNQLNDLNQRLLVLETTGTGGGGQLIIQSFIPESQREVGKELAIKGKFDFPPEINSVTMDGIPITNFRSGSNDGQLLFLIPPGIGIPKSGSKSVRIRVANSKGQDERTYLVLSAVPSSVPNPSIAGVVNLEDTIGDPTTLEVLKKARITGANFGATPADNIVKFKVNFSGQTITYPLAGGPPLTIDPASTPTQIVVTVPDIIQISKLTTAPVTLEVGVGTATPDKRTVNIFRP